MDYRTYIDYRDYRMKLAPRSLMTPHKGGSADYAGEGLRIWIGYVGVRQQT